MKKRPRPTRNYRKSEEPELNEGYSNTGLCEESRTCGNVANRLNFTKVF